jgi:hypothetical protein
MLSKRKLLLSLVLITGLGSCDRQASQDHQAISQAASKQEVAELRGEIGSLKASIATLQSAQLITRVSNLETQLNNGATHALQSDQISKLTGVVSQCVKVVHDAAPTDYTKDFYDKFDAYYNPGSGRVENNNTLVGGLPAVYLFNKCMASGGFPLK